MNSRSAPPSMANIPAPGPSHPANGSPTNNGHATAPPAVTPDSGPPPASGIAALLTLVPRELFERLPKEAAYDSAAAGEAAQLASKLSALAQTRTETQSERLRLTALVNIPEAPMLPPGWKAGVTACGVGLSVSGLTAWFSSAIYVDTNFAQDLWRGLALSSPVPFIPLVFKWLFTRFIQRRRTLVEAALLGLSLVGFSTFGFCFGRAFAWMENKNAAVAVVDYAAESADGLDTPPAPSPPADARLNQPVISLHGVYVAAVILESIASFILFVWLLELLEAARRARAWLTDQGRLAAVTASLRELDQDIAALSGRLAVLEHRQLAQVQFLASLNALAH